MSNLPIEQQIAELTPEQKNAMGKIYKKYAISIIAVLLLCVIAIVVLYAQASTKEEQAKEEYDIIQTKIALYEQAKRYDLSLYDESMKALDEYHDAQQAKYFVLVAVSVVGILGILAVMFIFKKKYPYFSEKKYAYLKKIQKM